MSRIDDIAYSYAAEHSALGLDYNQGSDAVRYGYEKALEDVEEAVQGRINELQEKLKGLSTKGWSRLDDMMYIADHINAYDIVKMKIEDLKK